MTMPWSAAHAGGIVLGADGQSWGIEQVEHPTGARRRMSVTLVRHGARVTGHPMSYEAAMVVAPADVSEEERAASVLLERLGPVEIIRESWSEEQS